MHTTTACHSFDHVASCECQGPKYQCLGSVGFEVRERGNVLLRSAEERSGLAACTSCPVPVCGGTVAPPLSSRGPVVVPLFLYAFVLLRWVSSSFLRFRVSTCRLWCKTRPAQFVVRRPSSSSSSPPRPPESAGKASACTCLLPVQGEDQPVPQSRGFASVLRTCYTKMSLWPCDVIVALNFKLLFT